MQINLRTANALQQSLKELLPGTSSRRPVIRLTAFGDPLAEMESAHGAFQLALTEYSDLYSHITTLRKVVGRANVESGISDLLADIAYADKMIEMFTGTLIYSPRESDDVIVARVEKMKASTDTYVSPIDAPLLSKDGMDNLSKAVRQLKKVKQDAKDKLLALNLTFMITLTDTEVEFFKKYELI